MFDMLRAKVQSSWSTYLGKAGFLFANTPIFQMQLRSRRFYTPPLSWTRALRWEAPRAGARREVLEVFDRRCEERLFGVLQGCGGALDGRRHVQRHDLG